MPESGLEGADRALHVAYAYLDSNNNARARDVLRQSLSQYPNDPRLLGCYARAEFLLDNFHAAAWSAHAALAVAPQDELAMRIYALSLDGLGRGHEALWMAWRTAVAHPNEPLAHHLYARLLQKSRQYSSALIEVDQALRLNPTSVDALVLRGSILNDLGRIAESDAAYRQALSLDPGSAAAIHNMAVNRVRRGRFGHALRGFLGAAGLDPDLGDLARRNIGMVLRRVFRFVTVGAVILGVLVTLATGLHGKGQPTATLRVLAAVITAVLIAVLARLGRAIPRQVLRSVLREQLFVTLRLVHALAASVAGCWVTVFPGPPALLAVGVMLALGGLVLFRIGLFIGR